MQTNTTGVGGLSSNGATDFLKVCSCEASDKSLDQVVYITHCKFKLAHQHARKRWKKSNRGNRERADSAV